MSCRTEMFWRYTVCWLSWLSCAVIKVIKATAHTWFMDVLFNTHTRSLVWEAVCCSALLCFSETKCSLKLFFSGSWAWCSWFCVFSLASSVKTSCVTSVLWRPSTWAVNTLCPSVRRSSCASPPTGASDGPPSCSPRAAWAGATASGPRALWSAGTTSPSRTRAAAGATVTPAGAARADRRCSQWPLLLWLQPDCGDPPETWTNHGTHLLLSLYSAVKVF